MPPFLQFVLPRSITIPTFLLVITMIPGIACTMLGDGFSGLYNT